MQCHGWKGKFTVMGPEQPIMALVGREATFTCYLSPQLDTQHMKVTWFHDQTSRVIYHYYYGQHYMINQHQDYKGRTKFLQENISDGNVTLKLYNIRPSDEGKYRCHFESANYDNEKEFQVSVAVMGSAPQIYIEGDGNKRFRLVCTSAGWYPEPEVQWRDHHKKSLTGATVIKRKENSLFFVETSITVFANSKENVSCFIWNSLLNQNMEASVTLADDLFPNVFPWMATWIVTMFLASLVLSIFIFWNWKLKKIKGTIKKQRDELIGKTNELNGEVEKMNGEVFKLNEGLGKIKVGIGIIKNHCDSLSLPLTYLMQFDGIIDKLNEATVNLNEGIDKLNEATVNLKKGNDKLNKEVGLTQFVMTQSEHNLGCRQTSSLLVV